MTLVEALKSGRLSEFISEQELFGFGKANKKQFDTVIKQAVKERPPQDQTSGSPVRGGSGGKKTR